jgi:hypothetical protein
MAQQRTMHFDTAEYSHTVSKKRAIELLERIGPSMILTHSAGGPFGLGCGRWSSRPREGARRGRGAGPDDRCDPAELRPADWPPARADARAAHWRAGGRRPDAHALSARASSRIGQAADQLGRVPILIVTSDDPRFGAITGHRSHICIQLGVLRKNCG